MKKLTVASFFSGCGGLDLGLEGGFWVKAKSIKNESWIEEKYGEFVRLKQTHFRTIFACDIKPSAEILWKNYFRRDHVFHLESIVDLVKKAHNGDFIFPKADIVTGGFPCQDFSVAGWRKGLHSHKNHLNQASHDFFDIESRGMLYCWLREAIRIIRPKVFIAENVKGLLSMNQVKDIILNDFRNINSGYVVLEPLVLNMADYGVPQNRERVIFIGVSKSYLSQFTINELINGQINLYPEPTHISEYVTVRDVIGDLPEPEDSLDISQQKYSKARWYGKHCQGQTEVNLDGLAPTIRSEHHGNIEFRRLAKENGGLIREEYHLPQRRLTVRECARIQTFPDDYQFITNGVSASEAYKLIGNAVPPLFGYHIAKRLESLWDLIFEKQMTYSQIELFASA